MQIDFAFGIVVLIVSVILHEVSHGYMADFLGDPTARLQGRLTLNPLSHIDPLGSVILPALLFMTHSPLLIGYARPVPYNPYNLPGKYDEALVAGAGPAVNILLALMFGLALRVWGSAMGTPLADAFAVIVYINMLLALFNLIPLPPLDGSKVLSALLPGSLGRGYEHLRRRFDGLGVFSGTLLILLLFFLFSPVFYALLSWAFLLLTGQSL